MSDKKSRPNTVPPLPSRLSPIRFNSTFKWANTLTIVALLSASTLFVAPAGAQEASTTSAAPSENEVVITDKARAHFRAGVNLLQDPDGARYEEAYQQFKAAYAESPSWKILSNLGLAAMKLEKDGEAIDAFEKSLAEGGEQLSDAEREQTQRDLDTLKASVVTVTLTATPGGVNIRDERMTNSGGQVLNQYSMPEQGPLVIRVRPGNHRITAQLNGHDSSIWEFTASAASSEQHAFDLQKTKVNTTTSGVQDTGTTRPVPTSVWIGAGVTGAFTVGAVVTGVMALGKSSDYDDANQAGAADAEDLRANVKTLNLVTDVLIGGAVASGIVTTILYVTRPSVPSDSAFRVDPIVNRHVAGLSFSGNF